MVVLDREIVESPERNTGDFLGAGEDVYLLIGSEVPPDIAQYLCEEKSEYGIVCCMSEDAAEKTVAHFTAFKSMTFMRISWDEACLTASARGFRLLCIIEKDPDVPKFIALPSRN